MISLWLQTIYKQVSKTQCLQIINNDQELNPRSSDIMFLVASNTSFQYPTKKQLLRTPVFQDVQRTTLFKHRHSNKSASYDGFNGCIYIVGRHTA